MRRFVPAIAALVVCLFGGTTTAMALDEVTAVATALKSSPVYVAPNVPGSSPDTANMLLLQINDGDNIYVAMLPASALDQTGGDIGTFARQLDAATGHQHILGLATGNQFIGYSSLLPTGEATDLMNKAQTVSTSVPETLQTFIRDVHDWQDQNPTAQASKPQIKHTDQTSGSPVVPILIGLGIGGLIAFFLIMQMMKNDSPDRTREQVRFNASPDQVRDKLRKILELRSRVDDSTLRDLLTQVCRDCEAYFERAQRTSDNVDLDAETFKQHLSSVADVVERYIDIQTNPRYYEDPTDPGSAARLMQQGYQAISGFSDFVLSSIRQSGRRNLTRFRVDTDILSATRYS